MADVTCSIDGCLRNARSAHGLCNMHRQRWQKYGTTDLPSTNGTTDLFPPRPPRIIRECTVNGCTKRARGRWYCSMHYARLVRNGDPLALRGQRDNKGSANPTWKGDDITYVGAHCRVKRERGSARLHQCVDCGGPAIDWSYDHDDPNEMQGDKGPYSADIDHYDPRCKRCHVRFDQSSERVRDADGRFVSA